MTLTRFNFKNKKQRQETNKWKGMDKRKGMDKWKWKRKRLTR